MRRFLALTCLTAIALSSCQSSENFLYNQFMSRRYSQAGFTQRVVQAAEHTLPFVEKGEGEVVLLLHGFATNKDSWSPAFLSQFEGFRLIALDLPGFGEASYDEKAFYDMQAQAKRMVAFMNQLEIQQAHLVGNSMGATLAMAIAAVAPERVKTLSLIAPGFVPGRPASEYEASLKNGEANRLIVNDEDSLQEMFDLAFYGEPDIPEQGRGLLVRRYQRLQAQHERIFSHLHKRPWAAEEEIAKIKAPTTIIWGKHDRVLNAKAGPILEKRLNDIGTKAKSHTLEKCGHVPQMERPFESARLVLDAIDPPQ